MPPEADSTRTHHLDARGTFCPVPILLTSRKIADLAPGDTLEVLGDDPGIHQDMPAWCADTGHQLLSLTETDGVIRSLIRKR